ncbi:MAG: bifunctional glutamate N-acetyltransferase/amino-acid acetyltransferase ArgJ [Dehalococcoidia bacterium]|nr:MAG: bifunctional glutamate N-acetyltransferase/amino-acid acetyltransferase ArgJ [Dehalococcoidia bacterium]
MSSKYKPIPYGTITSPQGFFAGATYAGIKTEGDGLLDLGILCSEVPCVAAGVFTTNKIKAAPVVLCQEKLAEGRAQAIVANSGCANACTGEQGMADSVEMADLTAKKLGISPQQVLVASTGVIGVSLPMESLRTGIEVILLAREGGHQLAEAIMTTDTFPKEIAVNVRLGEKEVTIGGVAKGAGMIYPNLATLLCFLATDAAVDASFAQTALRKAVDDTFNMIAIDIDTSPNDMVLLLASGLAGDEPLEAGMAEAEVFQDALREVCLYLAKCIARDGEGATKFFEVRVEAALTLKDARLAARAIASSPLVKAAIHGSDPNWGRIIAALGRSGAEINPSKIDLYLKDICLFKAGSSTGFDEEEARTVLSDSEVSIRVCLNLGKESATAWGCDLSEEYVTINSAYVT